MLYYLSADEPFLGPPLFFCAPYFNFMEIKWGPKEKWGPKKIFPALRAGNRPPTFNLLPTPLTAVVTAHCIRPEAFASDLGDDQSRYL